MFFLQNISNKLILKTHPLIEYLILNMINMSWQKNPPINFLNNSKVLMARSRFLCHSHQPGSGREQGKFGNFEHRHQMATARWSTGKVTVSLVDHSTSLFVKGSFQWLWHIVVKWELTMQQLTATWHVQNWLVMDLNMVEILKGNWSHAKFWATKMQRLSPFQGCRVTRTCWMTSSLKITSTWQHVVVPCVQAETMFLHVVSPLTRWGSL